MMTFWCDEHPIINSKLNVTFHRMIGMNNREFAQWSEGVGQKFHAKIDIFRLGSEVIHQDRKFQKNRGKIDLVFTSPPYFSAEVYSEEKTQSAVKFPEYGSWRDGFLKRTLMTCVDYLRPGGFLLWNVADISHEGVFFPLEDDSQTTLIDLGMTYRGKLKLLLSSGRGGGKTNLRLPSTKNFVIVKGKRMTETKQRRTGRLPPFREFVKHRSLKEEVAINTSGASLIRLDGEQTTEQRQSIIDEFSEDLNTLSNDGQLVIALAVALD